MLKACLFLALVAAGASSLVAQDDLRSTVVKHLKVSRDFSVAVAQAMPEGDYGFKLTPAQMSFGEQMVHLSQGFTYFLSPFVGQQPNPPKPQSTSKADIVAFITKAYNDAIDQISHLTADQLVKTFKSPQETRTASDLLLGTLDHSTHHRASAEMYLRAKGITPPEWRF